MKKKFGLLSFVLSMLLLSTLNTHAQGWGGGSYNNKTFRVYAENDNPNDIDAVAKFVQLNLGHEDYIGLNNWIKRQPASVQKLYTEWFPNRTVYMNENYAGDSNYGQKFQVPIFLWDGKLSEPKRNDPLIIRTPFEYVDLSLLYDNNQTALGKNGANEILNNLNLKAPAYGNTGTSYITISNNRVITHTSGYVPYGKASQYPYYYSPQRQTKTLTKADWRYIGFSQYGEAVPNPVLMSDHGAGQNLENRNYVDTPWKTLSHIVGDEPPYIQSLMDGQPDIYITFYNKLFEEHPKLKTVAISKGYPEADAWLYWRDKLMWYTNPLVSSGVVQGWHKVLSNGNWHYYYVTFQTNAPNPDNVSLDEITITDKETGAVVDRILRDKEGESYSVNELAGKTVSLDKGKTYIATAKSVYLKGRYSNDHFTTHTPATLNFGTDYDGTNLFELQKIDTRITGYDSVYQGAWSRYPLYKKEKSTNNIGQMQHNVPVLFKYEFTVDDSAQSSLMVMAKVDEGYSSAGDDFIYDDNFLGYEYPLSANDMVALGNIRLYQYDGNEVNSVLVDEYYAIEVTVGKSAGSKPVEGTTVDFFIDYGKGETKHLETSDQILKKDGSIAIRTPNIVAPTSGRVTIRAVINEFHHFNNENDDRSNDAWAPRTFVALSNFTVKDFKVVPQSINYGSEQTYPVSEVINLEAKLLNENERKEVRDVDVVIKQNGVIIKTERVTLPADMERTFIWNVPTNISNGGGTSFNVKYSVEINPIKNGSREYVEYVKQNINPYLDNYKENALTVFKTPTTTYTCEIVDNYNSWQKTFTEYEWRGHYESYTYYVRVLTEYRTVTIINSAGKTTTRTYPVYRREERTGRRCKTDSTWYNHPTYTHYERFEITNIYFKSKVTTDNYGGWVDIKSRPDRAKIKSGYGFEIRVVTKYTTNVVSSRPNAWRSGCNGMSYTPTGYHQVTPTRNVTITMPYKDKLGNNVKINLDRTSTSGSWTNFSQSFELPMRNSFGVVNERKIYIGQDVKAGNYTVKVDTDEFYGSSSKPAVAGYTGLCDKDTFNINVIGSMKDDTNTHIIQ